MPQAPARPAPLLAIQRGLESLYRVETHLDVHDFLLTGEQRAGLFSGRRPGEQLLLCEHEDGLDLALYLESEALETLARHDPRDGLTERNLQPLLLVLEGVSHFIYTVDRARRQRSVSALELELQAEVDKFVALVLLTCETRSLERGIELIDLLYHRVAYHADLSAEERQRYRAANAAAAAYARGLHRTYLRHRALGGFLADVRRFWRLSCAGKLSHITKSP
jgi:hypothetical protein